MNRQQTTQPHIIAIAGANGMVGRHLLEALLVRGDRVIALVRAPESHRFPPAVEVRRWQATDPLAPVDEADAVVNLVGDPIFAQRWTQTRKQKLVQTRVLATSSLVEGIRKAGGQGRTFIHETITGPLISASPHPVTSRDFARIFARGVGRPRLFRMSRRMMELVWGERAAQFLDSHRMVPHVALSTGFQFRFPTLEVALADLLGESPLPLAQLMNKEKEPDPLSPHQRGKTTFF